MQSLSYSSLIPPSLFILLAMSVLFSPGDGGAPGLVLATAAVVCLYLAATPFVASLLIRAAIGLSGRIPTLPLPAPPGAIVVLSAGYWHSSRPGGRDVVDPMTLERLAGAVSEQRRTGLPILVSGGWLENADNSLAAMMTDALGTDFRVPVRWREDRSRTTYENALYSAEILRRAGIPSALVVTNSWHMARALWSFYAVGYPVVVAPLDDGQPFSRTLSRFFPQVAALAASNDALHELIGLVWYEIRYRPDWTGSALADIGSNRVH